MTLAEVLITLGIIGVVAALVIPAMIQNSQDAEYKTGKDKVRMSIAEAGKMMSVSGTITDGSSAQDFVENYLSKYLKIAKFCAPANMEQCGMPSGNPTTFRNLYNANVAAMPITWETITDPFDSTWTTSNPTTTGVKNNSYVFLSADGIAVNLFYNPYCKSYDEEVSKNDGGNGGYMTSLEMACMSGVYDMNGLKKPNQVGRDIGFFATFYNGIQSTSVAALPYKEGIDDWLNTWDQADSYCRGIKGQKLPTVDELSALYLGRNITGMPDNIGLWSASSLPGSSYSRFVYFYRGGRTWGVRASQIAVRCVRD
jgi:type II secretory pathway pseudopilin PulG